MIDNSTWLIEPVFIEDILEYSYLEILVQGYIVSTKNSLLYTTKLNSKLYPIKSDILAQQVLAQQLATVQSVTKQGALASGATLVSVSLLNLNMIFLFQFLNAAEMFNLIQFFNMDLDPLFLQFISTMQSSYKSPSLFDYFVNSNDGAAIPLKYQSIGFTTNLIMINSGSSLTILVGVICAMMILFLTEVIVSSLFKKDIKAFVNSFIFKLYL